MVNAQKGMKKMKLIKGNALQKKLQELGFETDGEDWDNKVDEE